MLVTHATLVKAIGFTLPLFLVYNFLYFVYNPQALFKHSLHSNTTLLSEPLHEQSHPSYAQAPSMFDKFFPPPNTDLKDFREWNAKTLRDLHACMILRDCGPNQMKVALLADNWIQEGVIRGYRGGEGIWGMSMYKNLRELGYTTLFSTDLSDTLFQYRMMPDLVKVVIRGDTGLCHNDRNCVKSAQNPTGIPAWKLFDMSYWPHHRLDDNNYPMKGKWLLSANPDSEFPDSKSSPIQYIGYSMESMCTKIPVVPLEERKNQVWMLMKQILYVYHHRFAWNRTYFSLVHEKLGVDFVGGWQLDKDYLGWGSSIDEEVLDIEDHANGIFNLGIQPTEDFYDHVQNSKMMIGMANPHWSPSPIDALCLGVPFLNPISDWDHENPWNKSRWDTQHPTLVEYDPPHVYHVHAKNFTGFLDAVESAIKTPIDRFIPGHMTESAVKERLAKLMETDWRAGAQIVLRQNMQKVERGEEAYIFEL